MKRSLYYLLCAIACTSMVGATLPMAAIAEAMQSQETAGQQAQADATSSDAGKAEDGTNTSTTADTVEDSTATSTGTSAANTESAYATNTGTTAATGTPAPSLSTQTNPTPAAISTTSQTGYAHSATASQNGVTFHRLVERRPRGHRDDLPRNPDQRLVPGQGAHGRVHLWDGGSQESVCDPSRQAWASYYSLRARARDRAQRIHVGPQFTCMELAKVPIPNQKW